MCIREEFSFDGPVIVLPEAEDERILKAASIIVTKKIANIILIGSKDEVLAREENQALEMAAFVNPADCSMLDAFAEKLYRFGLPAINSIDEARTVLIREPLYFGIMLVQEAFADGIVAGAVYSSTDVLRPALAIFKLAKDMETVFSYMVITISSDRQDSEKRYIFADCALNSELDAEETAEVARYCGDIYYHMTKKQPVIKILPRLTISNFKTEVDAGTLAAMAIFEERYPHMRLAREWVDRDKISVTGREEEADVYIFPHIASGNIGYKLVQHLGKGRVAGPFIKGLRKSISDLSRGCSVIDAVDTITLLSDEIRAGMR